MYRIPEVKRSVMLLDLEDHTLPYRSPNISLGCQSLLSPFPIILREWKPFCEQAQSKYNFIILKNMYPHKIFYFSSQALK